VQCGQRHRARCQRASASEHRVGEGGEVNGVEVVDRRLAGRRGVRAGQARWPGAQRGVTLGKGEPAGGAVRPANGDPCRRERFGRRRLRVERDHRVRAVVEQRRQAGRIVPLGVGEPELGHQPQRIAEHVHALPGIAHPDPDTPGGEHRLGRHLVDHGDTGRQPVRHQHSLIGGEHDGGQPAVGRQCSQDRERGGVADRRRDDGHQRAVRHGDRAARIDRNRRADAGAAAARGGDAGAHQPDAAGARAVFRQRRRRRLHRAQRRDGHDLGAQVVGACQPSHQRRRRVQAGRGALRAPGRDPVEPHDRNLAGSESRDNRLGCRVADIDPDGDRHRNRPRRA